MTNSYAVYLLLCVGRLAMAQAPATQQGLANQPDAIAPYRDAAMQRWDAEIRKLEAKDRAETHPDSSVLFVGSSSIRRWSSIVDDVAPYHPIQRGYGGARYSDVAVFAERLIHPHQYQALVLFVGNDIRGSQDDHTVDEVERLVRHVLKVSHDHQPKAPVLLIEVTPTSRRFAAWSKIRSLNACLREIALTTPRVHFIATAEHYLHPDTVKPRDELFVSDKLHLNRDGYRIWGSIIRRRLDEVLR